jgi:hypothetical protein
VSENNPSSNLSRQLTQVSIVPGGLNALIGGWNFALAIPANAEPITIRCFDAELRM